MNGSNGPEGAIAKSVAFACRKTLLERPFPGGGGARARGGGGGRGAPAVGKVLAGAGEGGGAAPGGGGAGDRRGAGDRAAGPAGGIGPNELPELDKVARHQAEVRGRPPVL